MLKVKPDELKFRARTASSVFRDTIYITYRETIIVSSPGAKDSPPKIEVTIRRRHGDDDDDDDDGDSTTP